MPLLRPKSGFISPLRRHAPVRRFSATPAFGADHVRIVEVGPRDGLQNEKNSIPLETKIELIERLAKTGVQTMEAGSFVPAKWVPQMASTSEILETVLRRPPGAPHPIAYNYLIPNIRGLETLLKIMEAAPTGPFASSYPSPPPSPSPSNESQPITSTQNPNETPSPNSTSQENTTEISLFAAATEKFSQTNTNCTIAESLERCKPITTLAKSKGIRVRGYVSVALGCPYEGPDVDPHKVAEMTATLLEMGCDEVSIADTTGMGTAPRTLQLLKTLSAAGIANNDIALHFHDTYGQALVNTVVGLEHGIRTFDSSVGGLGGCPYSKGATGNVATEDLIHLFHSLGLSTGVSLEKMAEIGAWITKELGRGNDSRAGKATLAKKVV